MKLKIKIKLKSKVFFSVKEQPSSTLIEINDPQSIRLAS
jgi:hypothetical protein